MKRKIDTESFLNGANGSYIFDLFQSYRSDNASVSSDWRQFFDEMAHEDKLLLTEDDRPPQWSQTMIRKVLAADHFSQIDKTSRLESAVSFEMLQNSIRALMLIRAYRVRGHLNAQLDPLVLEKRGNHSELLPETYGFTTEDMDKRVYVDGMLGLTNPTVKEVYDKLRMTYCQTVGVEFMHIQHPDQRSWIQERVEYTPIDARVDDADRLDILKNLIDSDSFERFLAVKYPGAKRFGLEGGESVIPALEAMLQRLGAEGVNKIVFGMAHRGRLSVLANIIKKPFNHIFAYFQGGDIYPDTFHGSGDVKYHLGYSSIRSVDGNDVALSLMPNPSHLEAVDPVVLGKVRAEQDIQKDTSRRRTVGVLLHGDAAFAGQGLVAEILELSGLKGYQSGGIIHIIINNQIGFTTSPPHSRSSPYSSDLAKAIQAPIFHVNGDDPEAVVWAMRLAVDFHRQFMIDVVLDIVCYRRHGHNEIDEPSFTQPLMYKKIAQHLSTKESYANKLITRGLVTPERITELTKAYETQLQTELEELTEDKAKALLSSKQWLGGVWEGIQSSAAIDKDSDMTPNTGVDVNILKKIASHLLMIPADFKINHRLERVLKNREPNLQKGENLDWAAGEALAIGSLLLDGKKVRLSGQDVGRGTFSHRHAVWVDQDTEEKYVALNHIGEDQAPFEIVDSPLAEASVLGFEYGYSLADPQALVIWEAQFGDFSNGAQVIIDQFISSGEHKWYRLSGLVMLLPHGYEGQGPEHSSARLERYLQLCAQDNLRVVNCSTPANFFHVLRRQLCNRTRKPLIVMTPKTLLRHKLAVSSFDDMKSGTKFEPVIGDVVVKPKSVKRVILCSGKIYYELYQQREEHKISDIALIRLEQYYPFPQKLLTEALAPYGKAEFVWCQEEPANMGAWLFLDRRLESVLTGIKGAKKDINSGRFNYIGRPEAASPATGNALRHEAEQTFIIRQALNII